MKTITFSLSQKSIKKAIKEIEEYKVYLKQKTIELRQALAQVGLETAESNVSGFDGITFEIREDGDTTLLVGWSAKQIRTWWNTREGQVIDENYSPILMAEFGSGKHAVQGHRGTYPTGKGNGLKDRWSYKPSKDEAPVWTDGETPTRPMMKASDEMASKVIEVARKVFGNV